MSEAKDKYTLRISRLTIDKLGIQMYDRVSAVLAELIANAYDADAENVTITLPFGQYLARKERGEIKDQGFEIVIEDDGIGMTELDVNEYYLYIGYNRRTKRGELTPGFKRQVMGRKGIGKLAPFGICHEVEVITAGGNRTDKGYKVSNLILNFDIMTKDNANDFVKVSNYHPVVGPRDGEYRQSTGTTLILRRFNRRRVPIGEELNRQLAARFGLSQVNWAVRLKDSTGENDSFELGTLKVDLLDDTCIDVSTKPLIVDDRRLPTTGWVAYAKAPYKDEVMAGVRLYARKKIVAQTRDFDIKSGFTGEFKMRSYLTGEIHAEWLDEDDDLIQTDRQDIIWNSDYGNALREWGREILKELASKAEPSTRKQNWDVFRKETRLEERLVMAHPKDTDIRDAVLKAAKSLVSRLDGESVTDPDYRDRIVILAYAIGPRNTLLTTLNQVASSLDKSTEVILGLFEKASLVEMYSLGQVAKERVDAIKQLRLLVSNSSTVERDLQKLIETAPWILYSDWTPLSFNQPFSSTRENFESWYLANFNKEIVTSVIYNPKKEPDFVMLNHEGRLEIVEIKRPQHAIDDDEFDRAFGYLTAIRKFISDSNAVREKFPKARLTIVCDKLKLKEANTNNIRIDDEIVHRTWHDLLESSTQRHEDFLSVVRELQGELPEMPEESE